MCFYHFLVNKDDQIGVEERTDGQTDRRTDRRPVNRMAAPPVVDGVNRKHTAGRLFARRCYFNEHKFKAIIAVANISVK